jgi:tetratricopeptide (TPR) repeat protein/ribonuclease BN (tRNA processing enzyme)
LADPADPALNASTSEPASEFLDEFRRLFNAAYKEHAVAGRNASSNSAAHIAAVDYAKEHSIRGAADLLEALVLSRTGRAQDAWRMVEHVLTVLPAGLRGHGHYLRGFILDDLKNFVDAVREYEQALATPDFDKPGNAWHNLGISYAAQKQYDRAIGCYEKALATPGYDFPGTAWQNLGISHAGREQHDRAIECYEKALATPGYDSHGTAWQNRGISYTSQKQYGPAIECYEKALATPGYDSHDTAWHGLGFMYAEQKEHDRAIECYEKALSAAGYSNPGSTWNNLGVSYAAQKQYDRAIECYEKALATTNYDGHGRTSNNLAIVLRESGRLERALRQVDDVLNEPGWKEEHDRAKYIKQLILSDLAKIPTSPAEEALAKTTAATADPDAPESRMGDKLQGLEDKYQQYLRKVGSQRDNTFCVLRGWSSAVTLLEGSDEGHWRGGGYFLKWQDHGIVVDPGFDFLDNFHDAGFHAREIDAVLVSHDHSDHNFDLRSVDDLRYEVYRRSTEPAENGSRRPTLRKCQIVIDEDTARAFGDGSGSHRDCAFRFSKADFQRNRWLAAETTGLPLTIQHFPVQHGDDVPHAVGIRLHLDRDGEPPFVIGYTGDTCYFDGLADRLHGCDLLIAHISQPDPREFSDESFMKEVHLGYNGATKLIREVQPKLTLIGEFWAGLADLRVDLIHGLRLRTGVDIIFPAGLGFHLRLPSLEIECTECKKPTHFSQIRIAPPTSPFGPLGFLCQRCLV